MTCFNNIFNLTLVVGRKYNPPQMITITTVSISYPLKSPAGIHFTAIGSWLLVWILFSLDHSWNERSAGPTTTLTSNVILQNVGFMLYQCRFFNFLSTPSVKILRSQTRWAPSWRRLWGSMSGGRADITMLTLQGWFSWPGSILIPNCWVKPVLGIGRPWVIKRELGYLSEQEILEGSWGY